VLNENGLPQHLREVTHEANVTVEEDGESKNKKPDYAFRIGTELLFYLETKKPAVDITSDILPAFQLRRYGWSGNLKISVLTNFTDLYIYDCSVRPVEDDDIGVASDDPLVQVCLDRFKTDMGDKYKDHIFSEEEIQDIILGFFEQNRELRIGHEEQKQMTQIIEDILYAYNEYAKSLMSSGERTLHNTLSSDFSKIMDKLGVIEEQPRKENIKKFLHAIEVSKEIELENIEELINGEYEIDRSEIIETIQAAREKLVSIQGNAGSGKSVVCKKLLKGKEYVLVTRAENLSTGKKMHLSGPIITI